MPSREALELLDSAPCGLMQTTDGGTFIRANRLFCTWLGYEASDLVGVRRLQDLLTVGGRIFHLTHWAPLLQMQGSISEVKLEFLHRDGSSIPVVVNALVRVENGEKVHEIAAYVARDRDKYEKELVRSRKRMEDLFAQATKLQAEARDRAVFAEQMMGIVSHDLRNPLSAIQMGIALLGRGDVALSQQRALARIARSADRATRLISDLLDFTQARLGQGIAVTKQELDLHALVDETLEDFTPLHPAREIIHQRIGDGPSIADADRLAQLLGNLLSNAMAYGASDRPITVVSAIDAQTFSLSVHNGGEPIPLDAQATLFQPLTRASSAGAAGRSVGLGLYIVNEIARSHGGSASVKSTAAEGTLFTIRCPRALGS